MSAVLEVAVSSAGRARRVPGAIIPVSGAAPVPEVSLPVAAVVLEVSLAHLDHPFDYAVPPALDAAAVPGARVRVRFAGRLVSGYVVARTAASEHGGRLSPLATVVSPEPVLSPELVEIARRVAGRCAGTTADVLRLAIPPRHARVEAEVPAVTEPLPPSGVAPAEGPWSAYPGGAAFVSRLAGGDGPRAVLAALPGDVPGLFAGAAAAALAGGRGSVLVVPDVRDLEMFDRALTATLGPGRHVVLTADLGPAVRYRRWLAVRRGHVRVVLGTRAAAFAPVARPGLFACYDDGDDLLAEPRSPYCHARDVLATRAAYGRAGLLLAGHAVSTAGAALLRSGFAQLVSPERTTVRARTPQVVVAGDEYELGRDPAARTARIPAVVLRALRAALSTGPVLVQTPRAGYRPYLACAQCRAPARCSTCSGPLAQAHQDEVPGCRWCGRPAPDHRCAECGSPRLRSRTVGAARTADELGRAFPGVPVLVSGAGAVPAVPDGPALVVATPGAEPAAPHGYVAAALLDGVVVLDRPELAAAEEAARRWFGAAALVRPGGTVVLVAPGDQRAVQALVRWDPAGFADSELADRVSARLPPAAVVAELTGAPEDVADLLDRVVRPPGADLLGPVPIEAAPGPAGQAAEEPKVRAILRVSVGGGAALTDALRAGQSVRSARKVGAHVRIRIDPVDLG